MAKTASPSVQMMLKGILADQGDNHGSTANVGLRSFLPPQAGPHAGASQSDHQSPLADRLDAQTRSSLPAALQPVADNDHAETHGAGDGGSENWNSFVANWMEEDKKQPSVSHSHHEPSLGPSRLSKRFSTKDGEPPSHEVLRGAKSFVAELAEADDAVEQLRLLSAAPVKKDMDRSKQPKKSALKGTGKVFKTVELSTGGAASANGAKSEPEKPRDPSLMFKIVLPSLDNNGWDALVHQVVWRLSRHFGFQAFNANPKTRDLAIQEYVPSTAFLAADHLSALLCKQGYIRRGVTADKDEERFAKALHELHGTIFHSYEHYWCKLVGLPWRTASAQKVLRDFSYCDPRVIHGLLAELGLWFLIYTESSSLRHTPEMLWFIYWCMSTSFVMADVWERDLPDIEPNMRDRRIELRNLHQKLIVDIQNQLQIYPRRTRPEDCGRISTIVSRLRDTDVPDEDFSLLGDLIAFGDGSFYCDRIVTPIFDVFAYEVDHLSTLGVDVAHRLGYDDLNESMCVKEIIHDTLRELRVKPEHIAAAAVNDAYVSLTNLGFGRKAAMSNFEVAVASEFWHSKVFVKTYRERRTWAAVYRAYFRVWCVHLVAYQFLQVLAFMGWDWRMLSSCIVTHAILKAFERLCNWFMTAEPTEPLNTTLSKVFTTKGRLGMSKAGKRALERMQKLAEGDDQVAKTAAEITEATGHRIQRRHHRVEGAPLYGVFGFLEWILLAVLVLVWYVLQFMHTPLRQLARNWWSVFAASWLMLHFMHWVLTLRDGYMVSLTHMLKMPAIFKASSPRPDATCWMSAPMHMKWKLLWMNALFWFTVFAMKLPFDYFVICKPVVEPLKIVTQRHYLRCQGKTYWGVLPCIGGDWLLLAGRVCPFLVIIFMDTSLFYQITITIFGIVRGLFKLDLGVLTSWDEVVKEFYRAPARWWHKCMSELGNDNQLSQLKQSMYIEDSTTGGRTQVTDGMMFKKTVLTPEEIHGKKAHYQERSKKPSQSGASELSTRRADSVVDTETKTNMLMKMATFGRREEKKGGALLPSSTNRNKAANAGTDTAAKRKEAEDKRKEAQAKVSAKRAAIAAGTDQLFEPSRHAEDMEERGMSAGGALGGRGGADQTLQKLMSRAATMKKGGTGASSPTVDGGDEETPLVRPKTAVGGVKGMFNKLLSTKHADEEVDAVDKMAADARKQIQMRKQATLQRPVSAAPKKVELKVQQIAKPKLPGQPNTDGEGEEDEDESEPATQSVPDSQPTGMMGRLTTMLRGGASAASSKAGVKGDDDEVEEDEMEKLRQRLAARSVAVAKDKKGEMKKRPMSAMPQSLASKARPMSAMPQSSSAASAGDEDGGGSSGAGGDKKKKKKKEKKAAIKFLEETAPTEQQPSTSEAAAAQEQEEEEERPLVRPTTADLDAEEEAFFTTRSPGPVSESAEDHPPSTTRNNPRSHPEIQPCTSDQEGDQKQTRSGRSGPWMRRGVAVARQPGPLAEAVEEDDTGMGSTNHDRQLAGASGLPPDYLSWASSDSKRLGQTNKQMKAAKKAAKKKDHQLPLPDVGPAQSWWSLFGNSEQDPDRSLLSHPARSEARTTPVQPLEVEETGDDVRIAILGPGPVAEGAQDDLASWLNSSGAGAGADSSGAASPARQHRQLGATVVNDGFCDTPPTPGTVKAGNVLSHVAMLAGIKGRGVAKPLEKELDEVFGRPVDESRPGSHAPMGDEETGGGFHGGYQAPDLYRASMPTSGEASPATGAPKKKKGVVFHGGDIEDTPPPKAKKKAARFFDSDADDSGADSPMIGAAQKGGLRSALGGPSQLLGSFVNKFSNWNDEEQQTKAPSKPSSRLPSASVSVVNSALPRGGTATGASEEGGGGGGSEEEEDVEVDDVHYQMMIWNAFANAWDDVVEDIRQCDLISDKEVSMLKFVRLDLGSRLYGLRPILLPTFFYAGQTRKVVDTGQVSTAQVMVLSELRVLSVWVGCQIGLLSGKHAHVITSAPFHAANINVKHALHRKKFYNAGVKLVDLLADICSNEEVPFDMREFGEHLFTVFTSIEAECFAIHKAHQLKQATDDEVELSSILLEVVQEMKREISKDADQLKVIIKTAMSNSATVTWKKLLQVVRVIKKMLVATVAEATPTGEEAQRALGFFINSLSHPSLDRPVSLDKMWSWSILTPLYEEDVLYPLEGNTLAKELGLKKKKLTDLLTEGDDSISLMNFLKSTFPNEWSNFKERMKTQVPDVDVKELSELDFAPGAWLYDYRMELQLWASCRGQLLGRTVTGMMRNEKALRVLAKLEHPAPRTMSDLEYHRWIDQLVTSKFEMVITPQTYGKNQGSNDVRLKWLAKSIDLLLQRYPKCLKAAYLEKADVDGMGITEFSVCIKGRDPEDLNQLPHLEDQPVYELYRVRLPQNKYSSRGVILGEGKPENQNHATIFAFGEGIQAIDMNQDGYLCEWLKFRNLLAELQPSSRGDFFLYASDDEEFQINASLTGAEVMCVVRHRMIGTVQTALVGFREWIFSEAAGALGRFAAATEYAFGTISQRTMTHPARVRLHYGHPDLFNKLFVMTKGGISKATRLLHLTEDVFCGCNHTLRGARIRYKEYISCGKGRDMGFDSINGFNFKIAGGGGEWAISRESYRMGTRLDFFRLMAFYHAAVGFYINSWFTYLAVYLNVYALLLYAWAQATEIQADSVQRVYNVQQVLQLGTLALIPYAGQLMLENGVIKTCLTLFQQIATGSLLFYTFQQQTVASSFSTDMSYGSGKYVGTGRGFNIVSLEFVKIFTLYARSHLYMGFELMFALATLYIVRDCYSCNYGALTWSSWLLAVTLLFSPLWFNPFSFDMTKVSTNYLSWRRWMDGDVDHTTGSNWYTWNTVQLEKIRNDGGNNTDEWLNIIGVIMSTAPYVLMTLGAASRIEVCLEVLYDPVTDQYQGLCNRYVIFLIGTGALWLLIFTTIVLRQRWLDLAKHKPWRIYTWMVSLGLVVFFLAFFIVVQRWMHGRAIDTLLLIMYANFNILISFHKVVTPWFSQNNTMRAFVDWFYYTIDSLVGYIMFIMMALLSFIGVVGVLQMKLLFNDDFSEQVKHSKIGRALKEQKVGFDASKGGVQGPPSSAMPSSAMGPGGGGGGGMAHRGMSAASGATAFTMRSMVQSEHRYM